MSEDKRFLTKHVKLGFWTGICCQVCGMALLLAISAWSNWGALMLYLIGAGQLLYMVPALVVAWARGAHRDFLKGMGLTIGLMLLINGTCFGVGMAWIALGGEIGG